MPSGGDVDEIASVGGARLVGRRAEMAIARGAIDDAAAGRGSVLVISGEPGIGKTRLAQEVVAFAAGRGFLTAWTAAWERAASAPFGPWAELLRPVLDAVHDVVSAEDREHLARIVPVAGQNSEPTVELSQFAQIQSFEAVTRLLQRASMRKPFLLAIDDVQWADAASLQLLEFVASRVGDGRTVIVVTFRDTEPGNATEAIEQLARVSVRTPLRELDDESAREVARTTVDGLGTATVAAVAARAGGNPFYIRELARLAAAGGLDEDDLGSVPPNVRAVLDRRLARLPQETVAALSVAAVLGAEFRTDVVAAATGAEPIDVLGWIEPAVEAHLCRAAGGHRYAFAHPLVRSTLVETMSATTRVRHHAAIAEAMERRPELASGAADLAHHFYGAAALVGPGRAVPYDIEAGRDGLARTAFGDAMFHLERALGGVEHGDARARLDILLELGTAQRHGGQRRASRATFAEAAHLARSLGDPEALAHAALGMTEAAMDAGAALPARDHEAIALTEEALSRLPAVDTAMRARLLVRLSNLLRNWSDPGERTAALAQEADDIAARVGDEELVRRVWIEGHISDIVQDPDVGRRAKDLLRGATRPTDMVSRVLTDVTMAALASDLGGVRAAADELKRVVQRFPSLTWLERGYDAMLALLHGDLDEAERSALAIVALPPAQRGPMATTALALPWFTMQRERGRLADIEHLTRQFAERMPIPAVRAQLAVLLAETGQLDAARPVYEDLVRDGAIGVWEDESAPAALWWLSSVARALQDVDGATVLRQRLVRYAHNGVFAGFPSVLPGHVQQALAVTAAVMGDMAAAERHYEAALEAAGRMDAPLWRARTKAEHAAGLVQHGDDLDRAHRLASEARDEACRHEAGGVAAIAEAVIAHLDESAVASVPVATAIRAAFRRDGEVWVLSFGGREVRMRDSKGLTDLGILLARPGREVHVAELVGAIDLPTSGGEAVVDDHAIAAYRTRLADLAEEEDDARSRGDDVRAARARSEYEALVEHLTSSLGLGGRARRADDWTERARKTVRSRIGNTLKRIDAQHPALARHLRASIRTGAFCSYDPPEPVDWEL